MKKIGLICIFTAMATGIFVWLLFFRNVVETQTTRDGSSGMAKESTVRTAALRREAKKRKAFSEKVVPRIYLASQRPQDVEEDDVEAQPRPEEMARLALLYEAVGDTFLTEAPDAFDEVMNEEPIDDKWTETVEVAVQKRIDSGSFAGSTLQDVECHRTMCRIQLTHEDKTAKELFMEESMKDDALVGPTHAFSRPGEDGALQNSVYMGKYGQDFRLEQAAMDRLYEMVTGESADSVVPTESQVAQVATRMGE
jgi:hypothetical protein